MHNLIFFSISDHCSMCGIQKRLIGPLQTFQSWSLPPLHSEVDLATQHRISWSLSLVVQDMRRRGMSTLWKSFPPHTMSRAAALLRMPESIPLHFTPWHSRKRSILMLFWNMKRPGRFHSRSTPYMQYILQSLIFVANPKNHQSVEWSFLICTLIIVESWIDKLCHLCMHKPGISLTLFG